MVYLFIYLYFYFYFYFCSTYWNLNSWIIKHFHFQKISLCWWYCLHFYFTWPWWW